MFRAKVSPIIRSIWLYLQNLVVFTQVAAGCQPVTTWVNTTTYCKYSQVLLMMGEKHRPEHVELTWNNKLIYILHLVGYFHSCITMQGFMNVRFIREINHNTYGIVRRNEDYYVTIHVQYMLCL